MEEFRILRLTPIFSARDPSPAELLIPKCRFLQLPKKTVEACLAARGIVTPLWT